MAGRLEQAGDPVMRVIGIDEAGYGPLLGPLVVSAVGFEVPDRIVDRCLWDVLRASVSSKPSAGEGRLIIADSKKLYRGPDGLKRLESAALSWLAAGGVTVDSFDQLLSRLCPHVAGQLTEYPWYRPLALNLPVAVSAGQIETHANALRRDLAANGVAPAGLWVEALPAGHYNELVSKTRNKAVLLFGLTMRLVHRAAEAAGEMAPLRIVVDKQGGRGRYARPLMNAFGDRHLAIVSESADRSAYRLSRGQSRWQVEFAKGGEEVHLPIALASIFSKYIRQLFMICLNRFWQDKLPGLAPTEGYYVDAKRFLRDLGDTINHCGVDAATLVRAR